MMLCTICPPSLIGIPTVTPNAVDVVLSNVTVPQIGIPENNISGLPGIG